MKSYDVTELLSFVERPGGAVSVEPKRFLGFPVVVDPRMPPDTVEFRDATGRVVGRIIGLVAHTVGV